MKTDTNRIECIVRYIIDTDDIDEFICERMADVFKYMCLFGDDNVYSMTDYNMKEWVTKIKIDSYNN